MKKRVLLVANDYTTIYNFRLELLKRLKDENVSVFLALPKDNRNIAFSVYAHVVEIPLQRFGTNPLQDIKTFGAIRRLINEYRPEYVFTYTAKPNIYGGMACRVCKVPYACNVTGLGKNVQAKNFVGHIMLWLQKIAYKKANIVFFQNEDNLRLLRDNGIVDNQAELLPGSGVNLSTNQFEEYPENTETTFIVIARIRQDKGYDELFSAIKKCSQNELPVRFKIVGWYEDDHFKSKVAEIYDTGLVEIIGEVPHEKIHDLVKGCDCLIHPSHHEGMSNVILEAAASGRPCIVSDIHGCIEGVKDGISGYHFRVKDSNSLYEMIEKFASLSYKEKSLMGKNARAFMEEKFDRNIVVNRYISLLK